MSNETAPAALKTGSSLRRFTALGGIALLGALACEGPAGAGADAVFGSVGAAGADIQVADIGPICGECSTNPCTPLASGSDGVCRPTVQEGRPCGSVAVLSCDGKLDTLEVPGVCNAKGGCVARPDKTNICDNACVVSPHCDETGQCTGALLPAGTACGTSTTCVKRSCDGQGHCLDSPAAMGVACGETKSQCSRLACDGKGSCSLVADAGHPCKPSAPCQSPAGVCTNDFECVGPPLANGTPCTDGDSSLLCNAGVCLDKNACDDGKPCTFDVPCGAAQPSGFGGCAGKAKGTCVHVVRAGESCPPQGLAEQVCSTSTCSAAGVCETEMDHAPSSGGGFCCSWHCDMGGWELACSPRKPCAPEPNPCIDGESSTCSGEFGCGGKPAPDGRPCGTCGACQKGACTGSF